MVLTSDAGFLDDGSPTSPRTDQLSFPGYDLQREGLAEQVRQRYLTVRRLTVRYEEREVRRLHPLLTLLFSLLCFLKFILSKW
jgi:hypothetical protein